MPSGPELFIILAIVLLIFGGSQVPKLARNLGKAQKEFKDGLAESEREAAQQKRAEADPTVRQSGSDGTEHGTDARDR